jgi:hypothetical protein
VFYPLCSSERCNFKGPSPLAVGPKAGNSFSVRTSAYGVHVPKRLSGAEFTPPLAFRSMIIQTLRLTGRGHATPWCYAKGKLVSHPSMSRLGPRELSDMGSDGLTKCFQIISALKTRDDSAFAGRLGPFTGGPSQGNKVFILEP